MRLPNLHIAAIRKLAKGIKADFFRKKCKARFRRRTFHAPNIMQGLSATLERRLNQLSSAAFD
jgi:hypothetical protein